MTKLIQNMTRLEARLTEIRDRFGDPRLANVVLELNGQQTLLRPRPKVGDINPDRIGRYFGSNVEVKGDEEVITPLFRTLPEALYSNARYLLDAVWDGTKWVGSYADLLYLDRSNPRYYTAYVERNRGR